MDNNITNSFISLLQISAPSHSEENSSNIPSPPDATHSEVPEIDLRIGGIIKKLNSLPSLIRFAEKPTLENRAVSLNAENWAFWFNKVAKKVAKNVTNTQPLSKSYYDKIEGIIDKMLKEISTTLPLPPGVCAQISKAAGNLQLRHSALSHWIFENATCNLSDYSSQEFYMLLHGANKMFHPSSLQMILEFYSNTLIHHPDQQSAFLTSLKPQGVACILKACSQAQWQGHLSEILFKQICLREFSLQEKIDLIAGLSGFCYEKPETQASFLQAQALLLQIETELAKMSELPLDSLSFAMQYFANCGYIPIHLLPKVKVALADPSTKIWDKISLLYPLAILGMKEEFFPFFDDLMKSLHQTIHEKKVFTTIYFSDLVRFMYTAAVFLPDIETPATITEMVKHLDTSFSSLRIQDKIGLCTSLRVFGFFEFAKKVGENINDHPPSSNKSQKDVTKALIAYIKDKASLKGLKILRKGVVKGWKVDILIVGFKAINIEQKPLVIKIDGPDRWACNQPNHSLGKNILYSKVLKQAAEYEVATFDQRKGTEEVTQQVLTFIRNKHQQWQKTAF